MATTLDGLRIHRLLGRNTWSVGIRFGPEGWRFDQLDGHGRIIVSVADCGGDDWVHASISRREEMPSYADLRLLHAAVFDGGWAYQVFAPPSEHVNIHPLALHLWGRLDGKPALPDFTYGVGSI